MRTVEHVPLDLAPGSLYDRTALVKRQAEGGGEEVALEYRGTFAVVGLARDARVAADRVVMERADGPEAGTLHLFGLADVPIYFTRTPEEGGCPTRTTAASAAG